MKRLIVTIKGELLAKSTAAHLIGLGTAFSVQLLEGRFETGVWRFEAGEEDGLGFPLPCDTVTHAVVDKNDGFNVQLRDLLETKFDWLGDPYEEADGGDTVDAVMEMYTEAGGTVAEKEDEEDAYCIVSMCYQEPQEGSNLCIAHTGSYCEHGTYIADGDECEECADEVDDENVAGNHCIECGEYESECTCGEEQEVRP